MSFKTKHNLPFEAAPWPLDEGVMLFRVGTCEGQWLCDSFSYSILSVINNDPGNGHLDDVFQWFENSCKREGKVLKVLEVMNPTFKNHLLNKRGFIAIPNTDNVIKGVL